MKRHSQWAIAAGILFAVSFFLPAYGGSSGFSCLEYCWGIFAGYGKNHDLSFGGWLYYSGFVLANALFVALFVAIRFSFSFAKLRFGASAVAMVHVNSWLGVNLAHASRGETFDVRIGYFIWLLSFVLLFVAHAILGRKMAAAALPVRGAPPAHRESLQPELRIN
jgi:hypothetical protein